MMRDELKTRNFGVMRVSHCIEQPLIQSCSVENYFAIVRRANGIQGDDELSRILNINCDLITISQPHTRTASQGSRPLLDIPELRSRHFSSVPEYHPYLAPGVRRRRRARAAAKR
jgi:hypothetical protein